MKNNPNPETSKTTSLERQHKRDKTKTLKMKGLRIPRILLWIHGFFHGKILHTGGIDLETQRLSSAYVSGQAKRFHAACVDRRKQARAKLEHEWADADELIEDFKNISSALERIDEDHAPSNGTSADARSKEATQKRRNSFESDLLSIKKRLSNIVNAVNAEIHEANDQMEATSDLLQSNFACYGHGMLMKPVHLRNLPEVSYTDCSEQILKDHKSTWDAMKTILNYEEVA